MLARVHRCEPGCAGCRAERARSPAVDLLGRWDAFVASPAALRLARLCRRSGRPFPVLSADDVVQFCVEEAVFERLTLTERLSGGAAGEALAGLGVGVEEPAVPGLVEARQRAEHFRLTGERI